MSKFTVLNKYWIVPNSVLNDKSLSMKAKWLFWYLQSKPEGWDFSAERISLESKDWKDWINAGLKELERAWMLIRKKAHNEKGFRDIEYILKLPEQNQPWPEKPSTVKPSTEKPSPENPQTNKEITIKQYLERSNISFKQESFYSYYEEAIDFINKWSQKTWWLSTRDWIENIYLKDLIVFIDVQSSQNTALKNRIQKEWFEKYFQQQCIEYENLLTLRWRSKEEVEMIIKYIIQDGFRKDQILSIAKLHKKNKDWLLYVDLMFDKLVKYSKDRTQKNTVLPSF